MKTQKFGLAFLAASLGGGAYAVIEAQKPDATVCATIGKTEYRVSKFMGQDYAARVVVNTDKGMFFDDISAYRPGIIVEGKSYDLGLKISGAEKTIISARKTSRCP